MLNAGRLRDLGLSARTAAYDWRSAAGAAVVAVPAGAFLLSASATATAAGATMQIGAGNAVPIPVGGAFLQDVQGGITGAVNVTFVGTASYFVEWLL